MDQVELHGPWCFDRLDPGSADFTWHEWTTGGQKGTTSTGSTPNT